MYGLIMCPYYGEMLKDKLEQFLNLAQSQIQSKINSEDFDQLQMYSSIIQQI